MFQTLFKQFVDHNGIVNYQLDSFNYFVENGLQNVIDIVEFINPEIPDIDLKIKLGKVTVEMPSVRESDGLVRNILPYEARLRNLNYSASIYIDMTEIVCGVEQNTEKVKIGELPIMVKSKNCYLYKKSKEELIELKEDPYDSGGYFIINGIERLLLLIEEIVQNKMILEKKDDTFWIRVNSEKNGFNQKHLIEMDKYGFITITFNNIKKLPIIILFKALGIDKDKDIISLISDGSVPVVLEKLYSNFYNVDIKNQEEAIEYIGGSLRLQKEYRKNRVTDILNRYLFPHIGQTSDDSEEKIKYIGKTVLKLIKFSLGLIPEDDIDHYANKRVKLSGNLLEDLFRSIMLGRWGLIRRVSYTYQKLIKRKKKVALNSIIESALVTSQFIKGMSSAYWIGGITGVGQKLERLNSIKTLSHLRNVSSPLNPTQDHFEARQLHPTTFGRLCMSETPEGPTMGLVKSLALMSSITKPLKDSKKNEMIELIKKVNK